MSQINLLELEHLRHLIGAHDTISNKLESFSSQCSDQQVADMLKTDAQDAKQNKQKLMTFLQ